MVTPNLRAHSLLPWKVYFLVIVFMPGDLQPMKSCGLRIPFKNVNSKLTFTLFPFI